ncbi:MAG: hypothetical protein ACKVQS_13590 [Fimbriimonadaceae bacterium]
MLGILFIFFSAQIGDFLRRVLQVDSSGVFFIIACMVVGWVLFSYYFIRMKLFSFLNKWECLQLGKTRDSTLMRSFSENRKKYDIPDVSKYD